MLSQGSGKSGSIPTFLRDPHAGSHRIPTCWETAPLYAAAAVCEVRSLWLGHISDTLSLDNQEWESWQRPAAMTDVTVSLMTGLLERLGDVCP